MLGWSLDLKMALRVGSAMFYVTGSNSMYLEIFRYFTLSEEKLFRVSAVSGSLFKISPFSLIVTNSVKYDIYLNKLLYHSSYFMNVFP